MWINGLIYRALRAPGRGSGRKVHLGPGQKRYIPGWINVDANMFTAKCDVWVDLRNPLPFRPDSIACFYSHHMIEHLPDLRRHLREVYRCLIPGGAYRIGGPNGDAAIAKFVAGDKDWFANFPDNRSSIGGRFENFIFCRGEHLTILTTSFLEELLTEVGFEMIEVRQPVTDTGYPEWFTDCLSREHETDDDFPHTLVVEARKPTTSSRSS